jgi:menaquinone-dependent protoporphyrinogen IX oxidase
LLERRLTIVLCAMNQPEYETMLETNFDDEIRQHASIVHAGGAYDFQSLSWLERFAVKVIAKVKTSIDAIDYDKLDTIQ